MCYQVVERYSVCRCLYYKHAIGPCAAHGERGHAVQEKTVLVGYVCSSHGGNPIPRSELYELKRGAEVADIVDHATRSDDSSDDGESVGSTSITLSRCTSFIASEGQDTVAEVLEVLLEDPQLSWQKLVRSHATDTVEMKVKDVHFLLGAFERDLRAEADSTLQHHTCAFLRHRLRCLSSEIYEHFNVEKTTALGAYLADKKNAFGSLQRLQPIDLNDPDPILMPAFSKIREFLFDGTAYKALKENVRNFARHTRNYEDEMADIVIRHIHPPRIGFMNPSNGNQARLTYLLRVFLANLAREAEFYMLSASDRARIKSTRDKLSKLSAEINAAWTQQVPFWHFYPLIHASSSCASFMTSPEDMTEKQCEVASFETFVCSSGAFLHLANSFALSAYETILEPGYVMSSRVDKEGEEVHPRPHIIKSTFRCVSFSCSTTHSLTRD